MAFLCTLWAEVRSKVVKLQPFRKNCGHLGHNIDFRNIYSIDQSTQQFKYTVLYEYHNMKDTILYTRPTDATCE